ncbi:hypothetical protein SEA_CASSITA_15 [Microbacterium phage Cassita]|nr:hypothetical protein SEA_CASSITA_15 [Microbacterium phage Cassita]
MTAFKVGDRVRLTGKSWSEPEWDLPDGAVVTVERIDGQGNIWADGEAGTVGNRNGLYSASNPEGSGDFSCELVSGNSEESSSFEQSVHYHTNKIADLLIAKNLSYGDSALNPVRIFSKANRMEQLFIRLDDKLSRVQRGHEYPGDDTIRDIIGYCTLILIAREGE